jgi:hypothetical protein
MPSDRIRTRGLMRERQEFTLARHFQLTDNHSSLAGGVPEHYLLDSLPRVLGGFGSIG